MLSIYFLNIHQFKRNNGYYYNRIQKPKYTRDMSCHISKNKKKGRDTNEVSPCLCFLDAILTLSQHKNNWDSYAKPSITKTYELAEQQSEIPHLNHNKLERFQ